MEYIKESKKLSIIPFVYDLTGSAIQTKNCSIIMIPPRIESRITELHLSVNVLGINGIIELTKVLLFNKNIKIIDIQRCMLKSHYISFFWNEFGLFDNYSVEEINLSNNYLNENSGKDLAKMLSHLKNLKTINLSLNELKKGISSFLITLKNLYREGKTKLETLNLIHCELDDISYYELAELLKCKYCTLKKLYLNKNNIPYNVNFLKKLKKNRSLTQIYFNESNLSNNDTDDIMRIISKTNNEYLYLCKNKINNIDQLIKIIYRTKLIKIDEQKKNEEIYISESSFFNLDLSYNICINKNEQKIKLFKDILEDTTLFCLDFSHILYGKKPCELIEIQSMSKECLLSEYIYISSDIVDIGIKIPFPAIVRINRAKSKGGKNNE
jgi:hypothetical protein